jgi:hypothetical protein
MFNVQKCDIPTIWCGESNIPPKKRKDGNYYYKTGTRYECLKKGFGAGSHTEKNKNLGPKSLQQIRYIGETHERQFINAGIKNTDDLLKYVKGKNKEQVEKFLKTVLKKGKSIDTRSYNCVILYLYKNGNTNVPECEKIKL